MPISRMGPIRSKFYPLDSTHFVIFAGFHWDISGNWIDIYNFGML